MIKLETNYNIQLKTCKANGLKKNERVLTTYVIFNCPLNRITSYNRLSSLVQITLLCDYISTNLILNKQTYLNI